MFFKPHKKCCVFCLKSDGDLKESVSHRDSSREPNIYYHRECLEKIVNNPEQFPDAERVKACTISDRIDYLKSFQEWHDGLVRESLDKAKKFLKDGDL